MNKNTKFIAGLIIVLALATFAWAAVKTESNRVTYTDKQWFRGDVEFNGPTGRTTTVTMGSRSAITMSGALTLDTGATLTDTAGALNITRTVPLPLFTFMVETGGNGSTVGSAPAPLTTSTTPGLEIDDRMTSVVWADGETSPIQVSFRVPNDYLSTPTIKVFVTESDSTTPNQIDFDVYVNAADTASDTAATGQTPVAMAGTGGTSTPDEVTLTVATDFASLAAGHYVTLRLWRDNTADGTGDLELKGVIFSYTASQ